MGGVEHDPRTWMDRGAYYVDIDPRVIGVSCPVPRLDRALYIHFPLSFSRMLAGLQSLLLGTAMYGIWWFKVAIEEEVTVYEYLTNLVWIAIGTYYIISFLGFLESVGNEAAHSMRGYMSMDGSDWKGSARPDYIAHFSTLALGVPLLGTTTGVTFAVLAVIQDSPGLIFNYVSEYGEGTVVNVNFLMHVFTTLSVMVHIFLLLDQHRHVLFVTFQGLVSITGANLVTAIVCLLTYIYGHSIPKVYNLDDNLPASVVVLIFVTIIAVVICFFNFLVSPWNTLFVKKDAFWDRLQYSTMAKSSEAQAIEKFFQLAAQMV